MLLDVVEFLQLTNDLKHHETYKTEIKSQVLSKGRIYYKAENFLLSSRICR